MNRILQEKKSVLLALDYYVQEINIGVARYARDAGWILDDVSSHGGKIPPGWSGHGVVTLLQDETSPLAKYLSELKVPIVNLCNERPALPYPIVCPDNPGIGRVAAEELLRRGFGHFAFFMIDHYAKVVMERMSGFRDTVIAAGKPFYLLDFTEEWPKPNAPARLVQWLGDQLKKLPKPLGCMAQYDADANHIVRGCLEAGLRIPEDVAVIGVDNDPIYSELGPIPLSSVISNRELLGFRAAELLDQLMRGQEPPAEPVRIPPGGIMVRRSSDIFASEDPCLAKALSYIASHLSESINIDDVVSASGASRRSLYLKFSEFLGCSIGTEILRQRINRAKNLLSMTELKLEALAVECGFDSASSFGKTFRAQVGLPPSVYREKKRTRNEQERAMRAGEAPAEPVR